MTCPKCQGQTKGETVTCVTGTGRSYYDIEACQACSIGYLPDGRVWAEVMQAEGNDTPSGVEVRDTFEKAEATNG